jgi:ketosteroid isomerase-like protein
VSEADNIALYRRVIEQGVGVGNLDLLDELLDPDIALPTIEPFVEPTVEGLKSENAAFRAGAPDARATIDEIFAAGDWVAARLTWTGSHTGELLGVPATGRRFSVTEFEIVRCRDGRIVDLRQVFDTGDLLAQLTD